MGKSLRLGTRKSLLALTQSKWVKEQIEGRWPNVTVTLVEITTKGDKILDVPLAKVGGKGLFVKEIEDAIIKGNVDLAVHSLKDVPTELPEGLEVSIFPRREDYRDAFISNVADSIDELPKDAVIGTSSLRRMAQLKALRSDIRIESLRGNLDTRLRKLEEGMFDAIILAAAGLNRLGLGNRISSLLDPSVMLPAIGQGALGIEFRSNDGEIRRILDAIHHEETATCVRAERAFLAKLEGGCQVPIGALARLEEGRLCLEGMVANETGTIVIKKTLEGSRRDPEALGSELGQTILDAGGKEILEEVYSDN